MEQIILVVHVLAALSIIGLIMVQQGKGADMGASFGSGASQTLFGATGSGNVLTRATAILATVFFLTSLGLAYVAKHSNVSSQDIIEVPVLEESRDIAPVPADEMPSAPVSEIPEVPGSSEEIPGAN
jgi:preprotein translocase subunit SecG